MQPNSYGLKKIIIIGVIVLVIAAVVGFILMRRNAGTPSEPATPTDLFPYGTTTGTSGDNGNPVVDAENPPGTGGPIENPITMTSGAALRQITNYPVTDFIPAVTQKIVSEPKLDEKTGATVFVSSAVSVNTVRWNVKQTGILMNAEVTDDSIIQTQLTSTQVPNAQELWFAKSGLTAIYRTFDAVANAIASYRGIMPAPKTLGYCTAPFVQAVAQGTKSDQARELQRYLNYKLNAGLTTDGAFGAKSVAALKQLQGALELPTSGTADTGTLAAINADCITIRTAFEREQSEPKPLTGSFMPSGILRGDVSPDGAQLFLISKVSNDVVGTIMPADGGTVKNIFASPFTEWMPQWANTATIALTTMASREADGYLYFLGATDGNFKKIMGPIRGLTTLVSPDANRIIYSNSSDSGFATRVLSLNSSGPKTLDLATLPAKCVWRDVAVVICGVPQTIPNAAYPDAWYQGTVSFSDAIWSINADTGVTQQLTVLDQRIDAIELKISPDKKYLYFINKTDGTLWSLKLQ